MKFFERPEILILGPNPSWQKTMLFDVFREGTVNRVHKLVTFASGKGINAARSIATWNQSEARVIQFVGGENGQKLVTRLTADNIRHISVKTKGETRICVTCLDENGKMTEIIEPSFPPEEEEIEEYIAFFREFAPKSNAAIICGTAPGGTDTHFYKKLAREFAYVNNLPTLLDGGSGIVPLLESGKINCLKVNFEELSELSGGNVRKAEVPEEMNKIINKYGIDFVAVTSGPDPAYFASAAGVWKYTLPTLDKVVNPLGSGDTANGILWSEIIRGTAPEQAFKLALSAASANCLTLFCGHFPVADAAKIYSRIIAEKL